MHYKESGRVSNDTNAEDDDQMAGRVSVAGSLDDQPQKRCKSLFSFIYYYDSQSLLR